MNSVTSDLVAACDRHRRLLAIPFFCLLSAAAVGSAGLSGALGRPSGRVTLWLGLLTILLLTVAVGILVYTRRQPTTVATAVS